MELLDPATGRPLPADAIQRVLFIAEKVHVYSIPPMASMRGHVAASWTTDPSRQIFSARIRVIETCYDSCSSPSPSPSSSSSSSSPHQQQQLKVDTVLEDPATGQLFAASPYGDPAAVDPATDSSRFFALTVRDEAGRKAVLGIGFEERPEAFDFAVALQEARKALGWEAAAAAAAAVGGDVGQRAGRGGEDKKKKTAAEAGDPPTKDYSLKEGETITINIGGKFGRKRQQQQQVGEEEEEEKGHKSGASLQSFALAPPPSSSSSSLSSSAAAGRPKGSTSVGGGDVGFALPPPPSAQDVKSKRRSLMQMGFDDGQFGEFA
ncbi:hypothetical protein G3M48_003957 [Beauveria asiatica]|uniref:NECAP PHear domain-containing protein n=1 Tax=Beauveria asiatica TaxID=1069075 RepID=A0AAW0RUH8_9HYPO